MKTNLILASLLGLAMAGAVAAEAPNLIDNGNLETLDASGKLPKNWGDNKYHAEGLISLDQKNAAEGKISVQIENIKILQPGGFSGIGTTIWCKPLPEARQLKISFKISAFELTDASLVLMGGVGKEQKFWKSVYHGTGSFEWKPVELTSEIPSGTTYISFSFRNSGTGVMWIDDIKVNWIDTTSGK